MIGLESIVKNTQIDLTHSNDQSNRVTVPPLADVTDHSIQELCGKHGNFTSRMYRTAEGERWTKCPACSREESDREIKLSRAKDAADRADAAKVKRLNDARIPARFHSKKFDNFVADNDKKRSAKGEIERYAENINEAIKIGRSAVLIGKPGTGKTHLAVACIQSALAAGLSALYCDWADLMLEVRATYRSNSTRSEQDVMDAYIKPDILVLDEVGVTSGSDHEKSIGFHVINKRYLSVKPTIIVSNLSSKELSAFMGERVYDRLRENGGIGIGFGWESQRK